MNLQPPSHWKANFGKGELTFYCTLIVTGNGQGSKDCKIICSQAMHSSELYIARPQNACHPAAQRLEPPGRTSRTRTEEAPVSQAATAGPGLANHHWPFAESHVSQGPTAPLLIATAWWAMSRVTRLSQPSPTSCMAWQWSCRATS
jgi:hypothetical protein